MKKVDELTNPDSCMSRARPDEPTFVLLGRDAAAPRAITQWVRERLDLGKNQPGDPQIVDARHTASMMDAYCRSLKDGSRDSSGKLHLGEMPSAPIILTHDEAYAIRTALNYGHGFVETWRECQAKDLLGPATDAQKAASTVTTDKAEASILQALVILGGAGGGDSAGGGA